MTPKRRKVRLIEWYRADRSARIRRVLVLASTFVATGATVAAAGFRWGHGLAYVALLLVIAGGATAIAGLKHELMEERWLALRTDGLVYAHDGHTRRMPWRFIRDVAVEGSLLVVILASGKRIEIKERFAGTTRAHLREAIAQQCRRTSLGIR